MFNISTRTPFTEWFRDFAFDPQRTGIILCAGDKTGINDKQFYKQQIKIADQEFGNHLKGE